MMERKLSLFSASLLIIVLYIYLHNPIFQPMGGMGAIKVLYVLPVLLFVLANSTFRNVYISFCRESRFFYFIFVYLSLRTIVHWGDFLTTYTSLVALIEDFFLPVSIICLLAWNKVSFNQFVSMILVVGSIGATISTACLFSPSINSFVRESVVIIQEGSYLDLNQFRGFGISDSLTYSYGIIQGFIFSLGLFYFKENKWVIVFLPLMLVSILINARTGFLVAIVGFFLFLFQRSKSSVAVILVFAIIILRYLLPLFIGFIDTDLYNWLNDFFNELESVFTTGDTEGTTTGTLFGRMVVLPQTLFEWIFGRGENIFLGSQWGSSDMGWILQLNLGGLVYLTTWIILLFNLFKRLRHSQMDWLQIILLLSTLIIANTKGNALANSGALRLILLYAFYYIYTSEHSEGNALQQNHVLL